MSIPTLDSLSGVIGRDTIGEEENERFPVAFAFEGSFHHLTVDSVHQFVEPTSEGSTTADRNLGRIESDDILQRRNDLAFARKANDREPNGSSAKGSALSSLIIVAIPSCTCSMGSPTIDSEISRRK